MDKILGGLVIVGAIGVLLYYESGKDVPRRGGFPSPAHPVGDIKGNISVATGERLYHVPGMRDYEITVIDPSKGERWFRTEAEAIANGWRKAGPTR